jgi:hypothetical protein
MNMPFVANAVAGIATARATASDREILGINVICTPPKVDSELLNFFVYGLNYFFLQMRILLWVSVFSMLKTGTSQCTQCALRMNVTGCVWIPV